MKANSNVTVVIPCFNDGPFINKAIHSVLNQTIKPDQIIVVDDGSEQATKAILEAITYPEVKVVFQKNKGVSVARNVGIDLAKTDYILTLDADDYFESTFIEKAINILDNNPKIVTVGCLIKVLEIDNTQTEILKPLGGAVQDFLVKNNGVGCSMFRKSAWKSVSGYDEKMLDGYEDWEFWIAILKDGKQMHIIQEPLFTYRMKKHSRDKKALKLHDYKLREYIFNKHKTLYFDNFETFAKQILYQNSRLRQDKIKTLNSLNTKIGKTILAPLRFIKQLFTNKQ